MVGEKYIGLRFGGSDSMEIREDIIKQWFHMWLQKRDLGIQKIFAEGAVYIESWGPEYQGTEKIKLWFDEWNTRGTVLTWDASYSVDGR